MFAYELINLVEIALAPNDGKVAPSQTLGDNWRHQPGNAGYGKRLHEYRRVNFHNAMAIVQFYRQIVLLFQEKLDVVPDADEFRLQFVRKGMEPLVMNDDRLLGQTRHSAKQTVHALVARRDLRKLSINLGAPPFYLAFTVYQQAYDRLLDLADADIVGQA